MTHTVRHYRVKAVVIYSTDGHQGFDTMNNSNNNVINNSNVNNKGMQFKDSSVCV